MTSDGVADPAVVNFAFKVKRSPPAVCKGLNDFMHYIFYIFLNNLFGARS